MKPCQFIILISTMFLIGSLLTEKRAEKWFMLFVAGLWIILLGIITFIYGGILMN